MYCHKCGNEIEDNSKFCNKCGNQIIKDAVKPVDNSKLKVGALINMITSGLVVLFIVAMSILDKLSDSFVNTDNSTGGDITVVIDPNMAMDYGVAQPFIFFSIIFYFLAILAIGILSGVILKRTSKLIAITLITLSAMNFVISLYAFTKSLFCCLVWVVFIIPILHIVGSSICLFNVKNE